MKRPETLLKRLFVFAWPGLHLRVTGEASVSSTNQETGPVEQDLQTPGPGGQDLGIRSLRVCLCCLPGDNLV